MKYIDTILDSLTMYRVVLYSLTILILYSFVLSLLGLLSLSWVNLLASCVILLASCIVTHYLFKKLFNAPANIESTYITAFILILVAAPPRSLMEGSWLALLGIIAVVSKYIIAYRNRHLFNPAAFSLVILGAFSLPIAIWWVGSLYMLPAVLIVGLLVVKKIRRFSLFLTYILVSTITVLIMGIATGQSIVDILIQHFVSWPTIFFGSIMLTEPFTTPPTKKLQIIYAAFVGIIANVPFHIGALYGTPELALILGNIFSYTVSLKARLVLTFKEKKEIAKDTYEFVFQKSDPLPYIPGQYMEWTLPHANPDVRGIRRYFTIASSPFDDQVRLGVKMSPEGAIRSSFKQKLFSMEVGDSLNAASVSGDFLLPETTETKLVFIAGGIGITPFASMLRYLLGSNQKRKMILFYANKTLEDIAYDDVVLRAKEQLNMEVIDVLSEKDKLPPNWTGEVGFITKEMIVKYVPDWETSMYYISGPQKMVTTYKQLLLSLGVAHKRIVTDYFPGYA